MQDTMLMTNDWKNFTKIFILHFLVFFASGSRAQEEQTAPTTALSLSTYNLGLAYTYVPYAKERKAHLLEALSKLNSDVLCLQEVWTAEDQTDFQQSLSKNYPYSYVVSPQQKYTKRKPACYPTELMGKGKFGTCLLKNCRSKKGDEFTQCVVSTCRQEMNLLKKENNECAAALFSQVGKSLVKGVLTVLNPFSKVGLFAYEGSAGILLFSKHPLQEKEVLELYDHSTSNRRAALYASMNINNRKHHVLCTHLTADLSSSIPYTGPHSSWEEENNFQIKKILSFMEQKAGQDPHFLLGDFNCGASDLQAKIDPIFERNCQEIWQKGYTDPLIIKGPECTFCSHNTLVVPTSSTPSNNAENEGEDHSRNVLIDHIFVKNFPLSLEKMEVEVIFKDLVEILVPGAKKIHLSDHFGVKATLSYP